MIMMQITIFVYLSVCILDQTCLSHTRLSLRGMEKAWESTFNDRSLVVSLCHLSVRTASPRKQAYRLDTSCWRYVGACFTRLTWCIFYWICLKNTGVFFTPIIGHLINMSLSWKGPHDVKFLYENVKTWIARKSRNFLYNSHNV